MKHTLRVTLLLTIVFLTAQIVGLAVTNAYIDHMATEATGNMTFVSLPFEMERPPVEESSSVWWILGAILAGTIIVLLIIKFRKVMVWKAWFFLSVMLCLTISLAAFMNQIIAGVIAFFASIWKVYKPNIYVHNITEIFLYGGLAAIFVPVMNMYAVVILLILISIYDMYAVWKSKHMVSMAKFQSESRVFAGLLIPYKMPKKDKEAAAKKQAAAAKAERTSKATKQALKAPPQPASRGEGVKTAVLGGGDIGFPLLFAGVVMKSLMLENTVMVGFLKALIIPFFVTIALLMLLLKSQKDKFYPAMPFISAGCFVGYGALYLLDLLL